MVDKSITMNIDEVLELEYIIESISRNSIDMTVKPDNSSASMKYIGKEFGVFNPDKTGIYEFSVNNKDIQVDVVNVPDTVVLPHSDALNQFSRDTNNFSVDNFSPVLYTDKNDLSVKADTDLTIIQSNSGLNRYPKSGERFAVYQTGGSNADQIIFGSQSKSDVDDCYTVRMRQSSDSVQLFERVNGNSTALDSKSVALSHGNWYEIDVAWYTDGLIEVTFYDVDSERNRLATVASLSGNSKEFNSGGIGFQVAGSGLSATPAWDYWRITEIL